MLKSYVFNKIIKAWHDRRQTFKQQTKQPLFYSALYTDYIRKTSFGGFKFQFLRIVFLRVTDKNPKFRIQKADYCVNRDNNNKQTKKNEPRRINSLNPKKG